MTETKEATLGQRILWSLLGCVFLVIGLGMVYMAVSENIVRPFVAVGIGLGLTLLGSTILVGSWRGNRPKQQP